MRVLPIAVMFCGTVAAEPAWPAKGDNLDLTWVVRHEVVGGGAVRTNKGHVELVAKLGDVERDIPLADVYGGLSPLDQPMCATAKREPGAPPPVPYGKDEVAVLVFGGGVMRGYAVRRAKRDQLAIVAFDAGDESCGKPECPPTSVALLAIPARVKIHEHIVLADKAGNRAAFSCTIDP
jgi:hypothetical protein